MNAKIALALIIEEAIDALPPRDKKISEDELNAILNEAKATGIIDIAVLREALTQY